MDKKTIGAIVVLFVIALLLGAIIFAQQGGEQSSFQAAPEATESTGGSSARVPSKQGGQPDAPPVLQFPAQDASQKELEAHSALVDKLAEKAAYLDITKCAPKPLVLAHTKGEDLTVKNKDGDVAYVLRWGQNGKNEVAVPPGKSVVVKASMIDLGTTGYACYRADVPNSPIGTVGVIQSREASQ